MATEICLTSGINKERYWEGWIWSDVYWVFKDELVLNGQGRVEQDIPGRENSVYNNT